MGISLTDGIGAIMDETGYDTYRLIAQGNGFRIGLVAGPGIPIPPSITIEFLFRMFQVGERLSLHDMEMALERVRTLTRMGYDVFFQEGGWISCEKPLGETDVEEEAKLLEDCLGI